VIQYLMFPLPECCATCREWGLAQNYKLSSPAHPADAYCPALKEDLSRVSADLTLIVCKQYRVETDESNALVLLFDLAALYNQPKKEAYLEISRRYSATTPA
jgi:hypothetical protein